MTSSRGDSLMGPLRPCRGVSINLEGQTLVLLLEVGGRDLPVTVPLGDAEVEALHHVCALQGHRRGCRRRVALHTDLLRRALHAAGGWPVCLRVAPDPDPSFWLRVATESGPVEVGVDVLDAVGILLSRRLPVGVAHGEMGVWEETFDRLLEGGGR